MRREISQAERSDADIEGTMKNIVFLFAGEISSCALEPFSGTDSAFDRSLASAHALPDVSRIVLLSGYRSHAGAVLPELPPIPPDILHLHEEMWTVSSFCSTLAEQTEGYDNVFFFFADQPLLDISATERLLKQHLRYAAEYTFADGYPSGLFAEILAAGSAPFLKKLSRDDLSRVERTVLFDTIKKEINSFDIETDVSPVDHRQLRLIFAADSLRNLRLCKSFSDLNVDNCSALISARRKELYTVPAFYNVQISGRCPYECIYCPYPAMSVNGAGRSPGIRATERNDFMDEGLFSSIVEKIAAYSREAVVSLSLFGEPSYHPRIVDLIAGVLSHPGLSVLIETTGIGWNSETVAGIHRLAASAHNRTNGQEPVNWIVSLDAITPENWARLHGCSNRDVPAPCTGLFNEAVNFVQHIVPLFPRAVWPQMLRLKDNEEELESFYRFWKEATGSVIIQKHDHFCKTIEDRRVADLSPLERNPCWHLKRDMCIMLDGTVPLCREDVYASMPYGNVSTDTFETIRSRMCTVYEGHCEGNYEGMCADCDEYYTFNF